MSWFEFLWSIEKWAAGIEQRLTVAEVKIMNLQELVAAVNAKADAIAAVIPNIQSDVNTLKVEIAALKDQLPNADILANLEAAANKLGASVDSLTALDETTP